ncbi:MAG TPA: hypothetical protein VKH44_09450 [Pirellulaceae bacterium]|nr:hypothetical protein [Pirellulaceae bacterium]
MRFLSLRAIFLLGFVIAMPVLALPPVARRIDELLYGPPPSDFGRPPAAAPLREEIVEPKATAQVSPARYEDSSPAAPALTMGRFEGTAAAPALAPSPQFAPASLPPSAAAAPAPESIDERTISRLQQIRERLEQLGAEYVIVETQDSGRYRFHCRMLVDQNSRFTRPFEASSFDPVAAGHQVLRDVEAWRTAASEPRTAAAR